ncbi:MAG TPA: SpoIIE family protein phosphatase [Acidimicrobiales bacterium]|nr:SpoIIE family protein phosphatase [Acidimicrobiales bacterium]
MSGLSAVGASGPTHGYVQALIEDDPAELYETAPCGYLSTDPSGAIVKVNRTFLDWTGYGRDELVGSRRFQSLLAVGDRIFYETHFAPSLAMQGTVREIAVEVVCADGERLPALVNAVSTDAVGGRPGRIRIAVFDARERRSYERELLIARERAEQAAAEARALAETLQRTLLPLSPPEIPGMDVGTAYRPAGDGSVVGGDFYDLFELRDGTWGVTLGDVCGKGAPAAMVTALARHTVRALAVRSAKPSEVLRGLHDAIARSDVDSFCTALYLTVCAEDGALEVCMSAGGHHLPLRVGVDGTVAEVGRPGHLLGMLEPLHLHDEDVAVGPGEKLVLYTDGVIEAARAGDFFGEGRLHDVIREHRGDAAQDLADAIAGTAVEFQEQDTRDDIAVVVLGAAAST